MGGPNRRFYGSSHQISASSPSESAGRCRYFRQESFETAREVADNVIVFNEGEKRAKALLLGSVPKFAAMRHSYGEAGWASSGARNLRFSPFRQSARATIVCRISSERQHRARGFITLRRRRVCSPNCWNVHVCSSRPGHPRRPACRRELVRSPLL